MNLCHIKEETEFLPGLLAFLIVFVHKNAIWCKFFNVEDYVHYANNDFSYLVFCYCLFTLCHIWLLNLYSSFFFSTFLCNSVLSKILTRASSYILFFNLFEGF